MDSTMHPAAITRLHCGIVRALRVSMAKPRHVLPGSIYLVSRRCYQRTFRLRPSSQTTKIFKYCLALAMQKTGVELHAVCVMSNHHHLVITDRHGVLPKFLQELHRSTAKAFNALQGESENLWSAETCNAVRLSADEDLIDKIAYVAANPVVAGLVERPEDWPGLSVWRESEVEVVRPAAYFAEAGSAPGTLSLRVVRPASTMAADTWHNLLRKAINTKVAEAHHALQQQGRRFLGRAAVLAQSFIKRAKSIETKKVLVPTVAAKDPEVRRAMIAVQRAFQLAYRKALTLWRGGDRDAEFPSGTWWMRVFHGTRAGTCPEPIPR